MSSLDLGNSLIVLLRETGAFTLTQQNKAQLFISLDGKEKYVRWYQWSSFLSTFFKPIPHITSYHNFLVSADHSGSVFV